MREDRFSVSVPPESLVAGGYYLIGGPEQGPEQGSEQGSEQGPEQGQVLPGCEIVQVESEWTPGQPRRIRRGRLKTVANVHAAGTRVRAVTARFVADWAAEDPGEDPGQDPGQDPDMATEGVEPED
jgi:hypothetical protein